MRNKIVLKDARLKIKRANDHIAEIRKRLLTLQDSETSIIEIDSATGGERLKHDFGDRTAFTDIALMLGDAIHNLKCALDYTWSQTVARLVPDAAGKFSKFPVYQYADQLKDAMEGRKINTSAPRLFGFVMTEIKPYEGGNPAIWTVHKVDIRDKHRLLIPVFTNLSIVGIEVEDERGERHTANTWATTQEPPFYVDYKAGIHIKNKGMLSYEVIWEDSGYLAHIPGTITHFSDFVLKVVEVFERFLETQVGSI
jgi:hypothetical protein